MAVELPLVSYILTFCLVSDRDAKSYYVSIAVARSKPVLLKTRNRHTCVLSQHVKRVLRRIMKVFATKDIKTTTDGVCYLFTTISLNHSNKTLKDNAIKPVITINSGDTIEIDCPDCTGSVLPYGCDEKAFSKFDGNVVRFRSNSLILSRQAQCTS